MPRRPAARNKRKRVFVACEGESERGYAGFLWELAEAGGLSLHFDLQLCRGGDHLAVVEAARDRMKRRAQQHGRFWKQAIFLDGDRRYENAERTRRADRMIAQSGLSPIWSTPCLEALLLRHFPGRENVEPPTSDLALQELRPPLAGLQKTHIKAGVAREIRDVSCFHQRAAGTNPDLLEFLKEIGFPDAPSSRFA